MTGPLLLSVFLAALASGAHCALMCGGIAAGAEHPGTARLLPRQVLVRAQLAMHAGRITLYAALGALAGWLGQFFWAQQALPIQRGLFAVGALMLIAQGLRLLRPGARAPWLERVLGPAGLALWQRISAPLGAVAARAAHGQLRARYLMGLMWGALPCGLIYGVLPLAVLAGNAASGSLVMLCFGLGTLPNLMLISGFSAQLAQWAHRPWARKGAALVMMLAGGWGLYRAATLSQSLLRGGLCLTGLG